MFANLEYMAVYESDYFKANATNKRCAALHLG